MQGSEKMSLILGAQENWKQSSRLKRLLALVFGRKEIIEHLEYPENFSYNVVWIAKIAWFGGYPFLLSFEEGK